MTGTAKQVAAIAGPGLAWAIHFVTIYALISAACAPRALLDYPALALWGGIVTALMLAWCLWSVLFPPAGNGADGQRAAFWSGCIFALAVTFNAAGLFFYQGCGG